MEAITSAIMSVTSRLFVQSFFPRLFFTLCQSTSHSISSHVIYILPFYHRRFMVRRFEVTGGFYLFIFCKLLVSRCQLVCWFRCKARGWRVKSSGIHIQVSHRRQVPPQLEAGQVLFVKKKEEKKRRRFEIKRNGRVEKSPPFLPFTCKWSTAHKISIKNSEEERGQPGWTKEVDSSSSLNTQLAGRVGAENEKRNARQVWTLFSFVVSSFSSLQQIQTGELIHRGFGDLSAGTGHGHKPSS